LGRPPTRSGDLVAVSIDGRGAAWCDGKFYGDPEIVDTAWIAATCGSPVQIGSGAVLNAGSGSALEAIAALVSYNPGRIIVTQAPPSVERQLNQPGRG